MDRLPKVLLIGIDGCRPDGLQAAETPHLDALMRDGAHSFRAQTSEFTKSGPCWASMLTGVWSEKHGVTANSMEGSRFDRYPHFFSRLKQVRGDAFTASIVHWEPINAKILSDADRAMELATDAEVAGAAERMLSRQDADVLFLHFDDVDHAGHLFGYGPNVGYLGVIGKVDGLIGDVLAAVRRRTTYAQEDWLTVVSTDHGGDDVKKPGANKARHGDDVPEHRTVFLIVSGDTAIRGPIDPPPVTVDVPPTIFAHLGLPVDPAWGWEGSPAGLKPGVAVGGRSG